MTYISIIINCMTVDRMQQSDTSIVYLIQYCCLKRRKFMEELRKGKGFVLNYWPLSCCTC